MGRFIGNIIYDDNDVPTLVERDGGGTAKLVRVLGRTEAELTATYDIGGEQVDLRVQPQGELPATEVLTRAVVAKLM